MQHYSRVLFIVTLFAVVFVEAVGQERRMCITVDDLPTVAYGTNRATHQWTITKGIVQALVKYDAQGIGYVNERKLYLNGVLDSTGLQILDYWLSNGQDLGNHTYSHANYHRVGFKAFSQDILKGEKQTKALCSKYGKQLRYFRHPYLRSGADPIAADGLKSFLGNNGYEEAPVTIDNDDYLFALAYHRAFAKGDRALMDSIGESFISYMEAKVIHFEQLSMALFDRPIDQTLLIHANLLNAHWLDRLLAVYRERGYTFISQEEVLEDPAYETRVTRFGDWGISWLDRWALSLDRGKELFPNDPTVPTFVADMAR